MMVVYKLWTGLYYLKVPFWGAWGERGDCRLAEFCFVFKKFASVCYYRISREGRQSSEEIPTVTTPSHLLPFPPCALGRAQEAHGTHLSINMHKRLVTMHG